MDFEKLLILTGKYWDVKIHNNQNCIGKCLLWYKGQDSKDFLDLTEEEQREFWELAKKLKRALDKLFHPDKYNYLCAGNRTYHLHFHVIPRYKETREFKDILFEDKDFGKLATSSNEIPEELLLSIRDEIIKEISDE